MRDSTKRSSTEQLFLSFGQSSESVAASLSRAVGRPVSLILTDNSTSMLSFRKTGGEIRARLHRMFLHANDAVMEEIAAFIKGGKRRMPHFREFIRQRRDSLREVSARKTRLITLGKRYDLAELFKAINDEYFEGRISAAITWGMKPAKRLARKRTLGSYSSRTRTIRINPLLDRESVPLYFIRFVVYHEMLHADIGVEEKNGRRSVHPREFRRRERFFKEYERAVAWERRA